MPAKGAAFMGQTHLDLSHRTLPKSSFFGAAATALPGVAPTIESKSISSVVDTTCGRNI